MKIIFDLSLLFLYNYYHYIQLTVRIYFDYNQGVMDPGLKIILN